VVQLKARDWPGNVRELQNAIQAYAALGIVPGEPRDRMNALRQNFLELIDVQRPYADQKDGVVDFFTSVYLQELMARCSGNQSEAARVSGLSRGYLGRLLVKHGLARSAPEVDDE
jgi:DNA-binding NtrC family response regulator